MTKPNYQVMNKQIFQKFCSEINFDQSEHTQSMDKNVMTVFSKYVKKLYTDVTKEDVVNFFNAMRTGELLTSRGKAYGTYTIEQFKAQIRKFFKWLYNWKDGQALPEQVSFLKLNLKRAYVSKSLADCLTEDDIKRLIDTAETSRDKTITAKTSPFLSILFPI